MKAKPLKRLNEKHEEFTRLIFEGEDKLKAYAMSFGEEDTSKEKAARLLCDPLIKKRLWEMQDEALEKEKRSVFKTRERMIRELENIAFADIKDFYKFTEGSETENENLSLEDIPKEKRGAIASVTKGKGGITVKLHDKFKAIELLEKELASLEGKEEKVKGEDELKVSIKVC